MAHIPAHPIFQAQRRLGVALALLAACAAYAQSPAPMALSKDGAHVLDLAGKTAWSRCVEGMRWNGRTCVGTPLLLSRDGAMALAHEAEKKEGSPVRVARVVELQRLVHKAPAGLDPQLFPADPQGWTWAGTAAVRTERLNLYNYGNVMDGRNGPDSTRLGPMNGWAVNMSTGEARGDVSKRTLLTVRLVRPLD